MPVRQRLDIAGVRFLLINGGNWGRRHPEQMSWLGEPLTQTPLDQPLVMVNHVPPFPIPVGYRGTAGELCERFADRPARWWTMNGHSHARSLRVFQVGCSRVALLVVGTSNPLNTNGASDDAGFAFLCLSNSVHAVICYSSNRARYELASGPDGETPEPFLGAFEEVPGLVWHRLESRGAPPEVEFFQGRDLVEW